MCGVKTYLLSSKPFQNSGQLEDMYVVMLSFPKCFLTRSIMETRDWGLAGVVRPGSRKQPQITASCNHLVLMSVI